MGHKRWAIAEGYIPGWSNGPEPQFTSHETACLLNVSDEEAHVELTVFFSDREPIGPYRLRVPARRTLHVRFNELEDPEPIPVDTDYTSVIESDVPINGAAYTPGLAPGRERAALHHGVREQRVGRFRCPT